MMEGRFCVNERKQTHDLVLFAKEKQRGNKFERDRDWWVRLASYVPY
jgi:hypothetical protein